MATTLWGKADVAEEVRVRQRTGEKDYAAVVQLLENDREWFVRFAYATDGTARRGPLTLRAGDLERLRKALEKAPRLRAALDLGGE